MTHLAELRSLQKRANRVGLKVTYFIDEHGMIDQAYIVNLGLRDPLSAAEYLRKVITLRERAIS